MKSLVVLSLVALALLVVTSAFARTAAWVPGTTYYIEELDASDLLEQTYDSAYCDGVARFGKRGEFPYEEYHVFDCDIFHHFKSSGDVWCQNRYKSVKGSRRGYFKLRLIRQDCM